MTSTKQKWDEWELVAIKYLQDKWYKILETNYKFWRFWEIDIIAQKEKITIFIEVKYRSSDKFWIWEESITPYKLRKIKKTVESYCFMKKIDFESIRFDAVAIMKQTSSYKLKHYKNIEM